MSEILNSIQEKAKTVVESVADKAEKFADKATVKANLLQIETSMTGMYTQLGKQVYNSDIKTVLTDREAIDIVSQIREAETEADMLRKTLDDLNARTKCPNCGEFIPNEMSFCGHCGTKRPE